jgi:hypothetical protein
LDQLKYGSCVQSESARNALIPINDGKETRQTISLEFLDEIFNPEMIQTPTNTFEICKEMRVFILTSLYSSHAQFPIHSGICFDS